MSTPGPGPGTWGDAAPVLAAGATHLWLCDLDALRDPALLADYLSLLDTDEARRLDRLVFARDRHRFLVSHALLRYVLSLYKGLDGELDKLEISDEGLKPKVEAYHEMVKQIAPRSPQGIQTRSSSRRPIIFPSS